ncbi:MAG: Ribonuclease P protein component 2 [Methanomicrobiales archaeon 53_19]|jgi:ribonuclease P/MRP protein subunit POP5|uniref:Rpp14/Pop5 family protein n=1 Tax=Methanocalculus sp. TaxID=2004547 RepID=UPI000749C978|nr:Rpp14/Pop5 family protein [Methanocalculus sp.]KUL03091.1 MAG: Ribonuclease P protein component 2 [Methanomicrobiales archaeon 53_19]HIJ05740.1 ribonuclease P [Methanocalculus sp.]
MKHLSPTLRENKRYVLTSIMPSDPDCEIRELYYAVADSITSLYGDCIAAEMHAATILLEGEYLILRCRRGWERELCCAIAAIRSINGRPLRIITIATSGTIAALRKRIRPQKAGHPITCTIHGMEYCGIMYADGKIDLIKRDMKGQELVYLTKDDMEKFHATTTKPDGI